MKFNLQILLSCISDMFLAQTEAELPFSMLETENPVIRGKVRSINQKLYDEKKGKR